MLASRSLLVIMLIISSSLLGVVVCGPLQGMLGFHSILSVSRFLTHLTLAVKCDCVTTTSWSFYISSETNLNAKLNQAYLYCSYVVCFQIYVWQPRVHSLLL